MKYSFLTACAVSSAKDGIKLFEIDESAGKSGLSASEKFSQTSLSNISFIAVFGEYIYAADENDFDAKIHCLKLRDNSLKLVSTVKIPDAFGLCHLSISSQNSLLFASCYASGHAASFDISNPEKPKLIFVHDTLNDRPSPDMYARSHCTVEDPTHRFAFSVNIALDRIYSYKTDKASVHKNPDFKYLQLKAGHGPRHMIFHPLLPIAYCVTEYSNKLIFMEYSPSDGSLCVKDELSTLDSRFSGESYGASLTVSGDCKYLYVSNRGENSIAVFSLDEDGTPKKIQTFLLKGDWPRHIALSGDRKYMAVSEQRSNFTEILKLDNGIIKESVLTIGGENPCFVCQVKL